MRVAICTLGCKVNQYETQAMEQELLRRGHTLVEFEAQADAYVVNTCSVTAVSDKKSRQMLRRAKKQNPAAVVAACGCYSQTHSEEAAGLGIDIVAGSGDRMAFLDLLERSAQEKRCIVQVDEALKRREFEILPAGGMAERTRAMLKVEDGCVNFCSYCIIPYARGPIRSLPMAEAKRQLLQLQSEGYREVVITGIEICGYGKDLKDGTDIVDLVEMAATTVPDMRIRLGSLEPRTVTEEFCRRLAPYKNLCPQFHLSLQSGSDATLKRMNRKYDTARFMESVRLLRAHFENVAITTDLITGFPQETEEEFSETLAFIRAVNFADMHIFPYSIRPGTPAAKMEQIEKSVKEERAARAAAVAAEMHREYLLSCVGQRFEVLFEQEKGGRFLGHAPNYMPVSVEGTDLHNKVLTVEITGLHGDGLAGTIAEGVNA